MNHTWPPTSGFESAWNILENFELSSQLTGIAFLKNCSGLFGRLVSSGQKFNGRPPRSYCKGSTEIVSQYQEKYEE